MSWFRTACRSLAVLALVGGAGACGFEPLYARNATDDDIAAELAEIRIDPIRDRTGHMLQNRLRDALTPKGAPAKPRYILKITVTESVLETVVRQTAFAARANLTLNTSFSLTGSKGYPASYSGSVSSTSSYAFQTASLGTLAGEKDARERAVADAAEQIRSLLGIYFKRDVIDTRRN
ncbi:MAG: hypothetical protein FJX42_05920 [Alphaproteobacteria bacterium]|nr:hypothetical protein [Alphaproteobacteria bacterium]